MDKPIIMEAECRYDADLMLKQLSLNSGVKIDLRKLIDIRVETPLFGITEKKRKGKDLIWVGTDKTSDGWIDKSEYERIENLKNETEK